MNLYTACVLSCKEEDMHIDDLARRERTHEIVREIARNVGISEVESKTVSELTEEIGTVLPGISTQLEDFLTL
jgi:hypothetical protein